MTAKALLVRPNMAALCFIGSRFPVRSFLPGAMMKAKTHSNLSIAAPSLPTANLRFRSFPWPISRSFCIRASTEPDNSSSSAVSAFTESMEKKIKERLSADSVVVKDASGDGRHVCIEVVCSGFEGQSAVNRQRMVYKAIWEELQDRVHAVDQMTTRTPSEASAK
ncbi:protein BOLA4, chloroplastic/mitochondrial [Andrographis paniculata]|uniref:protein BOLA4, chloroplastic/mitochondrial n=1 Tax=Andrographis paniculata TaxID=175694 RepID=UPI0021E7A878|nr:protein BOLA4, chloroplastic/mitochondrial [Andrographis paniculata]